MPTYLFIFIPPLFATDSVAVVAAAAAAVAAAAAAGHRPRR
jgi:hypothetical protein